MEELERYFNVNEESWDQKVAHHAKSEFYDLQSFLEGKSSLNSYELEAMGDVRGLDLLHLQCHFGMDTLSWARLGARCTGIDFSREAIVLSRKLNSQLQLDATFVHANVLETANHVSKRFDRVFTSYGVIGWLPNLNVWATQIAKCLKPGGKFYMVEFHPIAWMFDYLENPPVMKYAYDRKDVVFEEYTGSYANENAAVISREYTWNHSLSMVISSLTEAGLQITRFREHGGTPYDIFPNMKKVDDLYYADDELYPLIFELEAQQL